MTYGMFWSAENIVQNMNNMLDKKAFSTGVVNWPRLFDGRCYRERRIDPNRFDVIHVQLAGDTLDTVKSLRKRITGNTKLVVNPDYSINFWQHYGTTPESVIDCFKMADFVFGQCRASADFLSEMLKREVPLIPHPLDTRWLKNHANPAHKRSDADVMINTHRDQSHHTPYLVVREYEDIVTHLVGFGPGSTQGQRDVVHQYYDHVHGVMPNADLIDRLYRSAFCAIDHYTHNVQGRSNMQLAALGVPCLGWDNVDTQLHCYPHTTSPYGDLAHQMQIFRKLRNDTDFVATVSAEASERVETYSFQNSRKLFMEMTEEPVADVTDVTGENNGNHKLIVPATR